MPRGKLEKFIRDKSHFDPTSEDTKHFQPELAEQIAAPEPDDEEPPAGALVEVSEDPMARSRMGAAKGEVIPLTPSKWREIVKPSDRCEFARRGVVTHGGRPRVLTLCITKRCKKHFPPAKPAKASKGAKRQAAEPEESYHDKWERENRERAAQQKAWEALWVTTKPLFLAHLQALKVKFNAALVAHILRNPYDLSRANRVAADFGVKLTDTTAALVLALASVSFNSRPAFIASAKVWKFDFKKVEGAAAKAAAPKAAKKPAVKKAPAKKAAKGKKR